MFEKLSLWKIFLLFLLIALIWVILSWRSDANAQASFPIAELDQDLASIDPGQLLQQSLSENFDIEARVTKVDDGADSDALIQQMLSVDQPFLLRIDGKTAVYTPNQLLEEGLIDSVWSEMDWELNAQAGFNLSGREDFYLVEFQGVSAIVAVDFLTFRGMLPYLSRIIEGRSSEEEKKLQYTGDCSDWLVLTNNIFGYPAEGLKACMHATCENTLITQCRTAAIPTFHGWTTSININPGAPIDGLSAGQVCNSLFGYTISYFVGNIQLPMFEFATGQSLSGAISSQLTCEGGIFIERR